MEEILDPEKPLEAPDLDPVVVFDLPTLLFLGALALMLAISVKKFLGTYLTILFFFGSFYALYRVYRHLKTKFPPGYWMDLITWVRTKEVYYPGQAEKPPPLVKR